MLSKTLKWFIGVCLQLLAYYTHDLAKLDEITLANISFHKGLLRMYSKVDTLNYEKKACDLCSGRRHGRLLYMAKDSFGLGSLTYLSDFI